VGLTPTAVPVGRGGIVVLGYLIGDAKATAATEDKAINRIKAIAMNFILFIEDIGLVNCFKDIIFVFPFLKFGLSESVKRSRPT